jgi:hypothetical protein
MKFIHRVGYYLGGLSIGLVILAFIWGEKRAQFCYSPECRVLKNINSKPHIYSHEALELMEDNSLDSIQIADILVHGDVNFKDSQTRLKPCRIYVIEKQLDTKALTVSVENCDDKATIQSIKID